MSLPPSPLLFPGDIKQEGVGAFREGPPYQRRGALQLWQFLVALLDDPTNAHFIAWTGRGMGFKLIEPEEVSQPLSCPPHPAPPYLGSADGKLGSGGCSTCFTKPEFGPARSSQGHEPGGAGWQGSVTIQAKKSQVSFGGVGWWQCWAPLSSVQGSLLAVLGRIYVALGVGLGSSAPTCLWPLKCSF